MNVRVIVVASVLIVPRELRASVDDCTAIFPDSAGGDAEEKRQQGDNEPNNETPHTRLLSSFL